MTIKESIPDLNIHKHQVILLDEKGRVYESCNTIFDTENYKGKSICNEFFFLESEFKSILQTKAGKVTFEKMQTEFDFLPGYYDFVFVRQEIDGRLFVIWDIYDCTSIYEQYINVQQVSNELDIQEQFEIRKSKPVIQNSLFTKFFFQSDYITKNKFDHPSLLNNVISSKFDVFDLINCQEANQLKKLKPKDLKLSLNLLINEINIFLKNVKQFQEKSIIIREVSKDIYFSQNHKNNNHIEFSENLPKNINFDTTVLTQLIKLLCQDSTSCQNVKSLSLKVGYDDNNIAFPSLLFCLKEQIDDENVFLKKSVSRIIKLSVLESLLSMLGGTLENNYLKEELTYSVDLSIPVK